MENDSIKLRYSVGFWFSLAVELGLIVFAIANDLSSFQVFDAAFSNAAIVLLFIIGRFFWNEKGILKRIRFDDDIILEYYLRTKTRLPFGSIVKLGKESLQIGSCSVALDKLTNKDELLNFIGNCNSKRMLDVEQEEKKKLTPKQWLLQGMFVVAVAAGVLLPAAYSIFYDRIPVHLIGQKSDSLLLSLLLVSIAFVFYLLKKRAPYRAKREIN